MEHVVMEKSDVRSEQLVAGAQARADELAVVSEVADHVAGTFGDDAFTVTATTVSGQVMTRTFKVSIVE